MVENIVGKGENAGNHNVLNSLPKDKIFDLAKLKEFAENKTDVTLVFGREENIVGREENGGYWYFSFSHNVFKRLLAQSCFNPHNVVKS